MARIRSLKPEFWDDRKLARSTSRDARMLYMGLWNQADEHSRLNGDLVWIKGRVFPYDDDITVERLKELLDELDCAGRVQRYEVEGDPYLFIPKLAQHQRLEPKVESRIPSPPSLGARIEPESSVPIEQDSPNAEKSAPHADESSLLYVAGSREQVAGSRVRARGSDPPAPDPGTAVAVIEQPTAQMIIAEWIERAPKRPPEQIIGKTGKSIAALLAEGIDPDDIRRGVNAWMQKGLDPSTLPSVVNEVMNGSHRKSRSQQETDDMFDRAARRLGVTQ
jgi:hypothetical protein